MEKGEINRWDPGGLGYLYLGALRLWRCSRADFGSLGRAVSGLMGLHFRVGFVGIAAMGSAASCNFNNFTPSEKTSPIFP